MTPRPRCVFLGLLIALLPGAPAQGATLFGLLSTGELYASADGGVSWTIRSTLPVSDAVALAASTSSSNLFLVSASGSCYRSSDAGLNWNAVAAVPAPDLIAFVPGPSLLMLLTESGSVYTSADLGTNWTAVGTIAASDVTGATREGNTSYAVTRTGTVYRSTDGGVAWSAVGTITTSEAVDIVAHDGKLWVLTGSGDLARSTDGGATWTFVSTLSQVGMTALIQGENELAASTEAGEVAASANGTSWSWRGVINQVTVRALATDIPAVSGVVEPGNPGSLTFLPPWPNPATNTIHLALDLDQGQEVRVELFDIAGRLVARPVMDEYLPAGHTVRSWQPTELRPGIYHLRARVGTETRSQRIIWLGR